MVPRNDDVTVAIASGADLVRARSEGRDLAARMGFSSADQVMIATVISELARNMLSYARQGEIALTRVEEPGRYGLRVVARDGGPGIADVTKALQAGYSTSGSLGLGLPGARRLMDEFDLVTKVGSGTTVTTCKWKR